MNVIEYCTQEVTRQGHDVTQLDGIERVGWMLNAWSYALAQSTSRDPDLEMTDLVLMAQMIEPKKNKNGFRKGPTRTGDAACTAPDRIEYELKELFRSIDAMAPIDVYRRLGEIHAFDDGNGRVGKICWMWLLGRLLDPIFPQSSFWGVLRRNP